MVIKYFDTREVECGGRSMLFGLLVGVRGAGSRGGSSWEEVGLPPHPFQGKQREHDPRHVHDGHDSRKRCRLDLRVPDISSNKKDGAVNDHGAPHNDPVTDPVPAEKESQGKNKRHRGLEENVWPHTCFVVERICCHQRVERPPPPQYGIKDGLRGPRAVAWGSLQEVVL